MCRATKDCGGWSYCDTDNGKTCPGGCKALQNKYYTNTTLPGLNTVR